MPETLYQLSTALRGSSRGNCHEGSNGPGKKKEWERKLFHELKSCAEALDSGFGIKLFKGLRQAEIEFSILMFHRRHVYEHNGGEVDQKYIDDSGDTSVKPKQALHETKETASRVAEVILKIARNFHDGFHVIFPPEAKAINPINPLNPYKKPNQLDWR